MDILIINDNRQFLERVETSKPEVMELFYFTEYRIRVMMMW